VSIDQNISVVMISMNEESAIEKVLDDINLYAPNSEIILVDSSTDKTPIIASKYANVKIIRQYPPEGYGPAITLGFLSATRPIIVTMDCDSTYPANQILNMAYFIHNDNYDLVDGSRLQVRPINMPLLNYFANLFFARIASLFFMRNIKDLHSGMRAYKRTSLLNMGWDTKGRGHALPVELLLRMIRRNFLVKIYYIDYHQRLGDSKMNPLPSAYWTAIRILRTRFTNG